MMKPSWFSSCCLVLPHLRQVNGVHALSHFVPKVIREIPQSVRLPSLLHQSSVHCLSAVFMKFMFLCCPSYVVLIFRVFSYPWWLRNFWYSAPSELHRNVMW